MKEARAIAPGGRRLTGFEHILLGYIAREPQSGYRLKQQFNATPANVYQPSPGALYPALRRLVGRGLLSVDDRVSAGRRGLRLYQVTKAGRAAHLDWLRQPVDPAAVGSELGLHLMRFVMMEGYLEREEILAFLKSLAEALEAFVSGIERYLASAEAPWTARPARPTRVHGRLALEHGIAVHRASLTWARSAIATLAGQSPPLLPPLWLLSAPGRCGCSGRCACRGQCGRAPGLGVLPGAPRRGAVGGLGPPGPLRGGPGGPGPLSGRARRPWPWPGPGRQVRVMPQWRAG